MLFIHCFKSSSWDRQRHNSQWSRQAAKHKFSHNWAFSATAYKRFLVLEHEYIPECFKNIEQLFRICWTTFMTTEMQTPICINATAGVSLLPKFRVFILLLQVPLLKTFPSSLTSTVQLKILALIYVLLSQHILFCMWAVKHKRHLHFLQL